MMTCAFSVTFPVLLGCYHSKSLSVPDSNSKSVPVVDKLLEAEKTKKKDEKKKPQEEINALFKPVAHTVPKGVDPKSLPCAFYKQGHCGKGDKCKFSHDLGIERKQEKRSMYDDEKKGGMEELDEAALAELIEKKHGESDKAKPKTALDIKKTAIGDEVILYTSEKNEMEDKDYQCFSNGKFIEEEVYATNRQKLDASNKCIDPIIEGCRQINMEPLSHRAPDNECGRQQDLEHLSHGDVICEGSKKKDVEPLSHVDSSLNRDWLDFPFFIDRKTVRYLSKQKTKIMFIMRGLSGSGKSSVVSVLKQTYSDAVICSADDYFRSEDGSYNFDGNKLSNAHGYCQNTAKTACREGKGIIVIDNTNVKRWEMKVYLEAAKLNGYVIVLVEPKTDWKFIPEELARKNKHGVPLYVLKRKVTSYDHIIPLYYGWFLSHSKSQSLTLFGISVFSQCLDSFPEFQRELLAELGVNSHRTSTDIAKEILLEFYTDGGKTSPLLHCTSRFCGGGKFAGGKYYHCRKDVQASCGQVFQLTLSGLVMTRRTFGVRVILDENSLSLFEHPEESEWTGHLLSSSSSSSLSSTSSACGKTSKKMSKKEKKLLAQENTLMQSNDKESKDVKPKSSLSALVNARIDKKNHLESVDDRERTEPLVETSKQLIQEDFSSTDINTLFPQIKNSGHGRCAHLTLKTARNVASKETNFDVLQACDIENGRQFEASDFIPVSKGKAVYLGHGICCVYFDQPIKINTIFSGYY